MKFLRFFLFFSVMSFTLVSCEKELSQESGSAAGTLKNDASGDCLPATVNGNYQKDSVLKSSNSVDIQVNIDQVGSYYIKTDTVNGYSFSALGNALASGLNAVHLVGSGKPLAVGTGVDVFTVSFGTSHCTFNVVVTGTGGVTTGTITATVNGVPTTFNTGAIATYDNTSVPGFPAVEISGTSAAGEVIDLIVSVTGGSTIPAGTYNVNNTTYFVSADYTNAASNNFTAYTSAVPSNPTPVFNIILNNAVTGPGGAVTGSFSGAVQDATSTVIGITSGTFNVPVH